MIPESLKSSHWLSEFKVVFVHVSSTFSPLGLLKDFERRFLNGTSVEVAIL